MHTAILIVMVATLVVATWGFRPSARRFSAKGAISRSLRMCEELSEAGVAMDFAEEDVTSREIERVLKKMDELQLEIKTVRDNKAADESTYIDE